MPPLPATPSRRQLAKVESGVSVATQGSVTHGTFARSVPPEHALRDREGAVRGRDAAVDRALEQDLLDLVLAEAVAQGGVDVHLELLEVAVSDERGERDGAAGAAVEAGAVPDLVPGVAGDQVLEVG